MDGLVDSGFVVLGGPLADEQRVVLAIEAGSGDECVPPSARTHGAARTSWSTRSSAGPSDSTAGAGRQAHTCVWRSLLGGVGQVAPPEGES